MRRVTRAKDSLVIGRYPPSAVLIRWKWGDCFRDYGGARVGRAS